MKIHKNGTGNSRISGTYAHGKLEEDMRYDIFEISKSPFHKQPDTNTDYYLAPTEGLYNCTYGGKDCVLVLWEREGLSRWAGLAVYTDDIPALEYAIKMFKQKSESI